MKDTETLNEAKELFENTAIKFSTDGKRHLGAALGNDTFRSEYAIEKVKKWCDEIEKLCIYAKSQPQAAYAAFIHGEQHKFCYFLRTIQGMSQFMQPLDKLINDKFIPTLLDSSITQTERDLFSLPVRLGGLGIPIFTEKATSDYENSKKLTAPLAAIIVLQGIELPDENSLKCIRADVTRLQTASLKSKTSLIEQNLDPCTTRAVKQAQEKGAGSWLNVLPLEEQGFTLTKGEFRDGIALRYNKPIRGLPSKCPCGQKYDVNHALNCKRGGFVSIRHNNIRDFEANLLRKIHNDVETEPLLQAVNEELITGLTGVESRPDIRARGVWRSGQNAYFDVRVTNVNADSQKNQSIEKILKKHENEKKRQYNCRIMNIEHGTFTPLIFAINDGVGPECVKFHQHLADRIASKSEDRYETVLSWIRCKLSFIVLRASLLCIRGSRSHIVKFYHEFRSLLYPNHIF